VAAIDALLRSSPGGWCITDIGEILSWRRQYVDGIKSDVDDVGGDNQNTPEPTSAAETIARGWFLFCIWRLRLTAITFQSDGRVSSVPTLR
jgi:hypothetical protein